VRLSRDDILKAADRATEEVDVPEWGGSVLVRGLSGRERDEFEVSMSVRRDGEYVPDFANTRAKLVTRCVVDDDGNRVFDEYRDVEVLGEKSAAALDRVYSAAARLSGLGETAAKEAAENFGEAPGASSSSASPPTSA